MEYSIIVSSKDLAGINIKKQLLELFDFENKDNYYQFENIRLYEVEKESIYCENIDVKGDIIIFATKHQSSTNKHSLSVHFPGNWGKADFGGNEKTLNIAPSSLLKEMFIELNKQSKEFDGEITLEATHHGPTVNKPIMFIEIGSDKEQWENESYGKIIAKTIMNVLSKNVKEYESLIALGGGHYPSEFNKILLKTELAIGNICPKYALENLDEDLLKQAIKKNVEEIKGILVDWKGLGPYKEKVKDLAEGLGIPIIKVRNVLKFINK
jgi:D-aminoacyl-tRNA deacylase